jgi:hypothetical protein
MANTRTVVEILNTSLAKIAEVKNLYPITQQGMLLRYSQELSDYGKCMFRVSTKDPLWTTYGDIFVPHQYHVRIKRGGTVVFQGAIIDNKSRNKNYVEINAAEYEFYLDKIRIKRNTSAPASWTAQYGTDGGWVNYRNFETGTMAAAVTAIINETIAGFGTQHVLGAMTLGTIETPDYPNNFVTSATIPVPMTGPWTFTSDVALQFDYHSVKYVLQAFGAYTNADFEITKDLVFNFKSFIGSNRQYELTFQYGTFGNIVDYDVPRFGGRMANDVMGIAVDDNGNVLHVSEVDTTSITTYGLMQDTKNFTDVKNENILRARLVEELKFIKTPNDSSVNIVLNEKSYPLGQYGIGDIVTVKIKDHIIDFNQPRRIVGITVNLHSTGREMVTIQTNKPKEGQYGTV